MSIPLEHNPRRIIATPEAISAAADSWNGNVARAGRMWRDGLDTKDISLALGIDEPEAARIVADHRCLWRRM